MSSANCTIILTQVTGLETIRAGAAYPTTVTRSGYLVAFTLGLSRLNANAATARASVHYLTHRYGGTPRAAITVLKPVGKRRLRRWTVMAQSETIHVQPYLGQVVQFPLATPIPVTRGEVVALTVPTWAPVLSIDLPLKRDAYRQSRGKNCANPANSTQVQGAIGDTANYVCDYPGTRIEYSVTEVTSPIRSKPQIH
ncbi:MAG: hypothetical protein M3Z27_10235 [Actinomycetota bacterium]|nr:hypothetical protein [Actinomycetota bacterium]